MKVFMRCACSASTLQHSRNEKGGGGQHGSGHRGGVTVTVPAGHLDLHPTPTQNRPPCSHSLGHCGSIAVTVDRRPVPPRLTHQLRQLSEHTAVEEGREAQHRMASAAPLPGCSVWALCASTPQRQPT